MVKIGNNEKTGMNTLYEIKVMSKTWRDEGKVYFVTVAVKNNGFWVREFFASKDGYFAYKNKSDADKLYKEVIHFVKSSGHITPYVPYGKLFVKHK